MLSRETIVGVRAGGCSWLLAVLVGLSAAGCTDKNGKLIVPSWLKPPPPPAQKALPGPINLLLPQTIRIHPFTGTRTFDEAGGVKGIEVRIEALDVYEDSVKAFGDFRFELYTYRPGTPDAKGTQINTWEASLVDPRMNGIHWDKVHRNYQFRLKWDKAIPVGQRFVLAAVFSSPFTDRLFDERIFTSGE